MATVPEFISVLRKIRDVIYPEINTLYEDSLVLKESIDIGKAEFDADLIQFIIDYSDFNTKKDEVDESVISANNSALSASSSATIATNKSNEIKAITAQSTTGAPGTSASASYNPTDGKFTFVIPQGSKGDKGESFTVNSSGATAQRALYDAQPAGWSFLDITTSTLYFKASNTSGDWSSGVPFGKGDKGDTGDTGVGIDSFTYVSTNHISGLPAQSGGTDTYRVTLTNALTFDYQVYNGLDYSQELLDDKLDKNFSTFTDKPTPNDTDNLVIQEVGGLLKKLSWINLKATLKTYFDTLYLALTGNQTIEGIKTFTSSPIAPTQSHGDNSTKVATTAYVDGKMVLGTAVTASGTAVDFTGIPNWVKKITVMFDRVSTNGASLCQIQVGHSGGFKTSGYLGSADNGGSTGVPFTTGLGLERTIDSSTIRSGIATFINTDLNTWIGTYVGSVTPTGVAHGGSSVDLTATLDRIRITTVNGTDAFDAGQINIMYEE